MPSVVPVIKFNTSPSNEFRVGKLVVENFNVEQVVITKLLEILHVDVPIISNYEVVSDCTAGTMKAASIDSLDARKIKNAAIFSRKNTFASKYLRL